MAKECKYKLELYLEVICIVKVLNIDMNSTKKCTQNLIALTLS